LKTPESFLDADQHLASSFVKRVQIHETLGSTNDRAKELARDTNIELPALIVARMQTAGRGRGQHTWWSADGALTFSLLIDSPWMGIAPSHWPQLPLATAVAVCDALACELDCRGGNMPDSNSQAASGNQQSKLGIKWPNDVFLKGGKVCGILIESPGGGAPAKDRIIIGIGINVNNSWRGAPHEAGADGTALCDVTGKKHDLQALLSNMLSSIAKRLDQLRRHDPELISAWQTLDILAGQKIEVQNNSQKIAGQCQKIAENGALLINTRLGPRRFYSGSVRVVP
jgi:BirA family biotin operon repressor/biotin-[acetyl-CoA-carboxylase] ligase